MPVVNSFVASKIFSFVSSEIDDGLRKNIFIIDLRSSNI